MSQVTTLAHRWDLLDRDLQRIGELTPTLKRQPTVVNNINRMIKRSLSGVQFLPSDVSEIDILTNRLQLWVSVDQGAEKSLGIFMWTDSPNQERSYGAISNATFTDLGGMLDQPIGQPWGYPSGYSADTILNDLAAEVGITSISLPNTGYNLPTARTWPSSTSRYQIMNEVAAMAGLYSPYFSNAGVLTAKAPPALELGALDYDSVEGGNVVANSVERSTDVLNAYNRWTVESVGAENALVWASYTVPASAPHSKENRGYWVTRTIQVQSLTSVQEAYDLAYLAAQGEDSVYEWVEFEAMPNFDHDTFDVVGYNDVAYREQSWTYPLGSVMHHSLRRHYPL